MQIKNSTACYRIALWIAVLSVLFRGIALFQTDFATGWDGYFYLVQMQSLVETSSTHTGDKSIIYHYLAVFYFIFKDYVLAFKMGVLVLLGGFVFLSILATEKHTSKKSAFAVGLVLLCSPHLTYFISQYPKNLLGVLSFVLFLYFFPQKWKEKRSIFLKNIGSVVLLLVLNYFSHKLTFFLAFLWLCIFILNELRQLNLLLLGIVIVFGISIFELDFVSYWSNWRRIHDALGGFSFAPYGFWKSFGEERISIFWQIEIIFSLFLAVVFLLRLFFDKNKTTLFCKVNGIVFSLLLLPVLKWDLEGVSFRLFMIFGVLYGLLIPVLIEKINFSEISFFKSQRKIVYALTFSLAILYAYFSTLSYFPKLHDPPNKTYRAVVNNFEKQSDSLKSSVELLILHKSFAEYFTFKTNIDALPWLPEYQISEDSLFRLATRIRKEEFEYYLSKNSESLKNSKFLQLGLNYFLLKESEFQKMLFLAKAENDTLLIEKMTTHQYNPSRVRPLFLLEQKE